MSAAPSPNHLPQRGLGTAPRRTTDTTRPSTNAGYPRPARSQRMFGDLYMVVSHDLGRDVDTGATADVDSPVTR